MQATNMLEADWTSGLSGRNFVGYRKGEGNRDPVQDPAGTVLYCVNNTAIPHSGDSSSGKQVVSLTVLGIPKLGWSSAPWTKKKGKAATEKVQTKPLFEVDHYERDSNGEKLQHVGITQKKTKPDLASHERLSPTLDYAGLRLPDSGRSAPLDALPSPATRSAMHDCPPPLGEGKWMIRDSLSMFSLSLDPFDQYDCRLTRIGSVLASVTRPRMTAPDCRMGNG